MKIAEPKTPYRYNDVAEEQSTCATVCPNVLTDKVKEAAKQERVVRRSSCHYQRMIHNNTHTTPTHLLYIEAF